MAEFAQNVSPDHNHGLAAEGIQQGFECSLGSIVLDILAVNDDLNDAINDLQAMVWLCFRL